nr:serine hydrolase domain-containing protein [Streptomyces antimycoticus]
MVDVQGTVADGFEPVRDAFAANFTRHGERGAAMVLYREGEKVVDLWGGTKAPDTKAPDDDGESGPEASGGGREPWTQDTAQVVRSVTKGVAAAVPLLLHQRGQLDLDGRVSTYWPEFKAAGKERVLVRHLLAHRTGVPVLDTPLTPAEAVDGISGPRAVAAQRPVWEPGEAHGYHAQTYSWLLGELVRRVTGRTIGRWIAEEIARPLGLDLWLGLPEEQRGRVGRIAAVEALAAPAAHGPRIRPKRSVAEAYRDPESLTRRAFAAITPVPDENDPAYLAAELPASGGVATAEALARFYAALIGPLPSARTARSGAGSSPRRRSRWPVQRSPRGRTGFWSSAPDTASATCCTARPARCWGRAPSATRGAEARSPSPTRRRASASPTSPTVCGAVSPRIRVRRRWCARCGPAWRRGRRNGPRGRTGRAARQRWRYRAPRTRATPCGTSRTRGSATAPAEWPGAAKADGSSAGVRRRETLRP